MDLSQLVREVGSDGPVVAVGGRTHWHLGGAPAPGAREVCAPAGIVEFEPAEMIVRCGAGTTVATLDEALAGAGQMVPLDPADRRRATVGGVLAAGWSGWRRLRYGPVRDLLLEATFVTGDGRLVKAGAPVVKNVTGFDLCRLLVGSLGTLGIIGEVVLRTQPRPQAQQWLRGEDVDPFAARRALHRPAAVLWNGETTWVLLEGHPDDIAEQAKRLDGIWHPATAPTARHAHRWSMPPTALRTLRDAPGTFLAEIGVGTVHADRPVERPTLDERLRALHLEVKRRFDPSGRLGRGRMVV